VKVVPGGHVSLVGAGPGDPGLLTRTAIARLRTADVVFYDALLDPRILRYARRAQRFFVGKRARRHAMPQRTIEALLVRAARRGKHVVRLKGGDPFVFGRGGEEVAALQAAGIAVEVVSGVTSGIAAPAAAGIAVTHRDCAPGVAFVTGHVREGGTEPDWKALAASGLTLVIYMGVARCAHIAQSLLGSGMSPEVPAAVIQDGTCANQRMLRTTLAALPHAVARAGFGSPAILVVGEVARAADVAERVVRSA
jgi:uroporphyrin-III C-methyltransferase